MSKKYDELSEYSSLEGSEIGDYCCSLLCLRDFNTDHGMSEEFNVEIDVEISRLAEMFKEHSTIINKTETTERTYKVLEWDE